MEQKWIPGIKQNKGQPEGKQKVFLKEGMLIFSI